MQIIIFTLSLYVKLIFFSRLSLDVNWLRIYLSRFQQQKLEVDKEDIDANKKSVDSEISFVASSDEEDQIENVVPVYQVVNKRKISIV